MAKTRIKAQAARRPYTCQTAVCLIGDYLSGTLAADIRSALDHHLRQCPDCGAFLNTYKKTIELTQRFLARQGPAKVVGPVFLADKRGRPRRKVTRRGAK